MFNRRNFLKGGAALGAFAATTGLSLRAARAEEAMRLFWFGSPARAERTLAVVALFEAANPGVKILGEVGGNDYWSKLTTMLAGGNAPDMFQLAPNRFSDYAGRGAIIGLDGYLGSTFRTDRLMPDAMKLGQIGDQVMGVPLGINSFAVLYDTVAFANTGLTPPGPDTTWDEFAAMCVEMTKALETRNLWAVGNGARYSYALEPFLLQRGKELYREDGQIGFDAKDAAEWYAYWDRMTKDGGCVSAEIQALDKYQIDSNPMSTGNAVMSIAFSNQLVGYQAIQKNPIGLTNLPIAEKGGNSGLFYRPSLHMGVASTAADPELAVRFLDFFINDLEAGKVLGVERGIPLNLDVRAAVEPDLDDVSRRSFDYIASLEGRTIPFPPQVPVGSSEREERVYRTVADRVAFGQITPTEAGEELVAQCNQILAA